MIYKIQRKWALQKQTNEFQCINYEFQTTIKFKTINTERFIIFLNIHSPIYCLNTWRLSTNSGAPTILKIPIN